MSTRKEQQLLDACERGELQTVRKLIERKKVNPNGVVDRVGRLHSGPTGIRLVKYWTPLHCACV